MKQDPNVTTSETFDWVIVGSGAGAMSSALVMRAAGKSVLMLEKTDLVGGTTAKSGGVIWAPANQFMDPGEDSEEKAVAYLDALVGDDPDVPGTSAEKRRTYVREARRMIDFLVKSGVEIERASRYWPDYYDELPGGCTTSRCVTAKPFDKKRLGRWEAKLRRGFLEVPAKLDDGMQLPFIAKSWRVKLIFAKIALAVIGAKLTGRRYVTAGAALQGRLLKAVLAAGVEVRLNAPVTRIVTQEGRVTGVEVSGAGRTARISANLGVLINAGGFARNQQMRDKYMPGTQAEWSNTAEGDTGDMHNEVARIGGVLAQMDQMVGYQTTRAPSFATDYIKPPGQSLTGRPGAILVDQSGSRYMNEAGSYELFCETMLRRSKSVPAVPSWAIFDQRYAEQYQVAGKWVGRPRKPAGFVESGYLRQADTIEELAEKIGVHPASLRQTVDRWNGFVDKGTDEDYGRGARAYDKWLGDPFHTPNPALGRIDKGPFYAVDMVPGDVSTNGGIVTDANGRVVNADGIPIAGLYATGVSTASPMGGVYPGAGASIGASLTFGYVAARHASGQSNSL